MKEYTAEELREMLDNIDFKKLFDSSFTIHEPEQNVLEYGWNLNNGQYAQCTSTHMQIRNGVKQILLPWTPIEDALALVPLL